MPEQPTTHRQLTVGPGTIVVFPSCLIHRAVASAESHLRRTIVLFDIENPDEPSPLRHDIIICPLWTQKPLLHGIMSAEEVEEQMLNDLKRNTPYFWRYFRRGATRRVHWQVTTADTAATTAPTAEQQGSSACCAGGKAGGAASSCSSGGGSSASSIAYNTSFYLIAPHEYPSHVHVYDHSGTLRYLFNLVRFHLGWEVLP